jgi:protein ImuB
MAPKPPDVRHAPAELGRSEGEEGVRSGPTFSLALRRLRPPRRVTVETCEGRPARVADPGGADNRVVTCAGPWRVSGQWWDVDVWARDEWDVALTDSTVWRLVHDRLTDEWSLDGVYD